MKFYTYSSTIGNKIHLRGWDDSKGGHFMDEVYFKPTLFVPVKGEGTHRSLDGTPLKEIKPGPIKQ